MKYWLTKVSALVYSLGMENTTMELTKDAMLCIHCAQPVRASELPGPGGVRIHAGHEDATLDQTCGTWGWRQPYASELDG